MTSAALKTLERGWEIFLRKLSVKQDWQLTTYFYNQKGNLLYLLKRHDEPLECYKKSLNIVLKACGGDRNIMLEAIEDTVLLG